MGTSIEEGYSIATDRQGNVLTAGGYLDSVDFDSGAGVSMIQSAGGNDIFLHKMDSAGNLLWINSYGGLREDYAYDLYVDTNGYSYLAGGFTDSIVLDTTGTFLTGAGQEDALVMRLIADGTLAWWNRGGGPGYDVAKCLGGGSFGGGLVHVAGEFSGTANLAGRNNVPHYFTSNGDLDVFLLGIHNSGSVVSDLGAREKMVREV